jgi:hypothetical protein
LPHEPRRGWLFKEIVAVTGFQLPGPFKASRFFIGAEVFETWDEVLAWFKKRNAGEPQENPCEP